ncbi:Gfo/Idh/MocA family oxidoreductase [candidate division KSB1 bacterium]|nr:Gfo/Idh/MocA family oxidoreductase [candidate division KSB1 bacterium]
MKFGIIGCGLIGRKRASVICGKNSVEVAADIKIERAKELAAEFDIKETTDDPDRVVSNPDVDAVIVATTHDVLAKIALKAIEAGKHVLIEKPGARNADELIPVIEAAKKKNVTVKIGFNHRFHPGLQKAKSIVDSGDLGPLMFIRGRYGHGGRLGYEKEWRAQPEISGGGELLDQGVHLIDLSRWFLGELSPAGGSLNTYFWDMQVDDNAFILLKTAQDQVAWLHATWTEWKNMFSFEIYGKKGKLHIEGLGGSYGTERLTYYRMLPEMGPPETEMYEFPGEDLSWKLEFDDFCESVASGSKPCGNLEDAAASLSIVDAYYQRNNS